MTTFPKEFARTEIQQILNYTNDNDDKLALAIYGLFGYALGTIFPDAQLTHLGHNNYPKIGIEAETFQLQIHKLKSIDPDFANALQYLKNNGTFLDDLETGNLPEWLVPVLYKLTDLILQHIFKKMLFK